MEAEEEEDTKKAHRKIKCLSKESSCLSKDCEKEIECDDPVLSTHCYAITKDPILPSNISNASSVVQLNEQSVEIVLAGCWTGGDECRRPTDIEAKLNKSLADTSEHYTNLHKYKIPSSLLNQSLQASCISYSKSHDLNSYFVKNNRSFCCCSTSLCNKNIVFSSERNPHELFAEHLNPKLSGKTTTPYPSNSNQNFHLLLNTGLLTGVLIFLLVFLFLLSFLVIFVIYKKKFKTKTPHLPAILFSKRTNSNHDDLNNNSQAINVNNTQTALILTSSDPVLNQNAAKPYHSDQIPASNANALNINRFNAELGYLNAQDDEDDFKNLTQPLLSQTAAFPTSIIAPNVVISEQNATAKPPSFFMPGNKMDFNRQLIDDLNDLDAMTPPPSVTIGAHTPMPPFFNVRPPYSDAATPLTTCFFSREPELHPRPIKATDIDLLERVAQGQFSSVWKAVCKQAENGSVYAVKIFAGNQRSAWSNEKEIYNLLSTTNEHIIKYYGSDTFTPTQQKNSAPVTPFNIFSTNEFWLITEYHPAGSLNDYLKANCLSWTQMIRLCYCLLEGLAYLHNENVDSRKSCAIAHRDLKSKNILVKSDGCSCCIGDFGLALKLNNANKLSSAEIRSKVGTRRYMSPELIEGAIAFTKETFLRIDVYACALTLWEIVSRGDFYDEKCEYKLPFEDEVGLNPSLDEMKEVVVDKSQRPIIKQNWLNYHKIATIAQTIEECWDIDLDARISSECAASRIRKIYQSSDQS